MKNNSTFQELKDLVNQLQEDWENCLYATKNRRRMYLILDKMQKALRTLETRYGNFCTNCGKDKDNCLSDWCTDCLEKE